MVCPTALVTVADTPHGAAVNAEGSKYPLRSRLSLPPLALRKFPSSSSLDHCPPNRVARSRRRLRRGLSHPDPRRVSPERLEIVKLSHIRAHDVNDDIEKIEHH